MGTPSGIFEELARPEEDVNNIAENYAFYMRSDIARELGLLLKCGDACQVLTIGGFGYPVFVDDRIKEQANGNEFTSTVYFCDQSLWPSHAIKDMVI